MLMHKIHYYCKYCEEKEEDIKIISYYTYTLGIQQGGRNEAAHIQHTKHTLNTETTS